MTIFRCVEEIVDMLEEQGIIPKAVVEKVTELFVAEDKVVEATAEAEALPSVEVTQLDMQWLQVIKLLQCFYISIS